MLRDLNEKVLYSLGDYREKYNLSGPLLVNSEKVFIDTIRNQKNIMYIGQETNGWVNGNDIEEFENTYKDFLYNHNYDRNFWTFLKDIIIKRKVLDNVIWANALICGKKDEIGTPFVSDKFQELSLEYLLKLYDIFKPDMTLIVSGPSSPYYEIIKEFLNIIGSKLSGNVPTKYDTLLDDKDNNVFYTYHPNYQNRIACVDDNKLILRKYYESIEK